MAKLLINSDLGMSGIYKAILLEGNKVYIPGITNFSLSDGSGTVNMNSYEEHKDALPTAWFCAFSRKCTENKLPASCWVTFECGDVKRPIILGFQGKSIKSAIEDGGVMYMSGGDGSGTGEENTEEGVNTSTGYETDYSNTNLTEAQRKVAKYAEGFTGSGNSAKSGWCQAWVADVYANATGLDRKSANTAAEAAKLYATHSISGLPSYNGSNTKSSTKLNDIPIGATIYMTYSPYNPSSGHAVIYLGNGKVAGNNGGTSDTKRIKDIQDFVNQGYKGFEWGWNGNYDLTKMK